MAKLNVCRRHSIPFRLIISLSCTCTVYIASRPSQLSSSQKVCTSVIRQQALRIFVGCLDYDVWLSLQSAILLDQTDRPG
jgi:hypothetical protein